MEWGWSDEFPGFDGVWNDRRDPNPRLRAWLSPWEHWEAEADDFLELGDYVVVLATYRGTGKGSLPAAQRQRRAPGDLRQPRTCPGVDASRGHWHRTPDAIGNASRACPV